MTPEEVRQEVQEYVVWHDIGQFIHFALNNMFEEGRITQEECARYGRTLDWLIVFVEDGDA